MRSLLGLLALALVPRLLTARGVTTAAIQASAAGADGSRVGAASVVGINLSDGHRWTVTTPRLHRDLGIAYEGLGRKQD